MREQDRVRVLYLVYWGALEPLGRSLVVPAVARLAALGAEPTLITYEKPRDLAGLPEVAAMRERLASAGVRWIPLRYHKRPKWPATAFDVLHGLVVGIAWALRNGRPRIVHARTFIGGLVGLPVSRALGARLVYHNEGFYPDEQVDGGVWREGSPPHRLARWLEGLLYDCADGLIVLSNKARQVVEARPAVARKQTPVVVVPSCVDLERFPPPVRMPGKQEGLSFVYVGSVGNRYLLDRMAAFVLAARAASDQARLTVVTPIDVPLAERILRRSGLPRSCWIVRSVPHDEVPGELAGHDAGLFFLAQGLSEHGISATKMGEYWASGLPVVVTPKLGDVDDVIRTEQVGVVLREHSDGAYRQALDELQTLMADPGLSHRCRSAAEKHYSLATASEVQSRLYGAVLVGGGGGEDSAWRSRVTPARAILTQPLRRLSGEPLLALRAVRGFVPPGFPILTYHSIGSASGTDVETVGLESFERQMEWLVAHSFRVLTVSALVSRIGGKGPPERCVALSFDDGYLDNLSHALPVLRRYGLRGTIYVVTSRLGLSSSWNPPDYIGSRQLLHPEHLRELIDAGIEIGSHSDTHRDLTSLPGEELTTEVVASRDRLERLLSLPVRGFSAPHGRSDRRVADVVRSAGYTHLVEGGRFAANPRGADPYRLRRITIGRGDSVREFAKKVCGAYQWLAWWDR